MSRGSCGVLCASSHFPSPFASSTQRFLLWQHEHKVRKRQNCSSYIPKIRHPPNTAAAGGKGKLLFRERQRGGGVGERKTGSFAARLSTAILHSSSPFPRCQCLPDVLVAGILQKCVLLRAFSKSACFPKTPLKDVRKEIKDNKNCGMILVDQLEIAILIFQPFASYCLS